HPAAAACPPAGRRRGALPGRPVRARARCYRKVVGQPQPRHAGRYDSRAGRGGPGQERGMGARSGSAADPEPAPDMQLVLDAIGGSLDRLAAAAVDAIWDQGPAYRSSPDPRLRVGVARNVEAVFRVLRASLAEGRPAQPADFPITREQAFHRSEQGVSLADFLRAFRIGQLTLWQRLLDMLRDDPPARNAALAVVGHLMQLIEVGSTVAAEAYLEAQQHQLADDDRVRRDLLEALLARRELPPGPKQAQFRLAGVGPATSLLVAAAVPVASVAGEAVLRDAVAALRTGRGRVAGLTVVRQDEIVGVLPVPARGPATVLA